MDTMDKVLDALKKGAKVLTGGKRGSEKGYFHEPTVLIDVEQTSLLQMISSIRSGTGEGSAANPGCS
jgi:hypothetical protein